MTVTDVQPFCDGRRSWRLSGTIHWVVDMDGWRSVLSGALVAVALVGCGVVAPGERSATANLMLFDDKFREGERVVVSICVAERCTTFPHVLDPSAPPADIQAPQFASVSVGPAAEDEGDGAMGQFPVTLVLPEDAAQEWTRGNPTTLKVEARVDGDRVIRGVEREVVFEPVPAGDCDCWWIDESVP